LTQLSCVPLVRQLRIEGADERDQLQEILQARGAAPGSDQDERIRRGIIGPGRGQGAETLAVVEEPDAVLAPVVAVVEQLEAPPVPRVEGVSDGDDLRPVALTGCS
jgi:hypothetical protein